MAQAQLLILFFSLSDMNDPNISAPEVLNPL